MNVADLSRWDGKVDQRTYLLTGSLFFAIKFALDCFISYGLFDRPWTPINYLIFPTQVVRLTELSGADRLFSATLLLVALPFIWIGTAFTLRRLRDAGLPVLLVPFFFFPVINLLFIVVLCIVPSRVERALPAVQPAAEPSFSPWPALEATEPVQDLPPPPLIRAGLPRIPAGDSDDSWPGLGMEGRMRRIREIHRRVVPDYSLASATVAVLVTGLVAIGFTVFGVEYLKNYGWGLFVGMPFCVGIGSAVLFGLPRPQRFGHCLCIGWATLAFYGVCMMVFAREGAICLLMAAPLAFPITAAGTVIGYALQARPWVGDSLPGIFLALVLTLPGLMAAEYAGDLQPPLLEVTTSVDIDAPPERVWRSVVSFPPLPEPDEWLFRAGVAYPTEAVIKGEGVGAERHCVFSTGKFVEPIEVWDEPRLLQFSVTDQPPPMKELSLYDIHPPHLDHYLVSKKGQFLLTPLGDGRTRLEGTTWYVNKMWPEAYWRLWSDHIIHRIHGRVLGHIKGLAEKSPANAE
jgi:hypothetical protein